MLTECYQNKSHSGLNGNVSPETAYRSDKKSLKFLDPETIANSFLHAEERKVDKSGCISFASKKYEVGLNFIGSKVTVVYNPANTTELTIEYEGYTPFKARELLIGERTGTRPKLPEYLLPKAAESSRLLTAATQKNKQRKEQQIPAVTYRTVRKGGSDNV